MWDTALAVLALADAGVAPDDDRLVRAADWLLDEEIRVHRRLVGAPPQPGAGRLGVRVRQRQLPRHRRHQRGRAGAAARRPPRAGGGRGAAIDRGVAWTLGMQCRDGGWGAVRRRQHPRPVPPAAVLRLRRGDRPAERRRHRPRGRDARPCSAATARELDRGVEWLWRPQEADGSWFGRWGANYVYGTGAAVPALVAAGVAPDDPRLRRAIAWLAAHQNPDGGWGEDLRSYDDDAWRGRGRSTPSQTAWALLALLAVGDRGEATERGVAYLATTQRADGTWDEPEFTGTGFPGDFYINYHLYRQVFPVMALGRYVRGGACA